MTMRNFVLMSASKSSCTDQEQIDRRMQLVHLLRQNGFHGCTAVGHTMEWGDELSVMVELSSDKDVDFLCSLGQAFQQDAILYVNENAMGFIISCKDNSIVEYLGMPEVVSRASADGFAAYTELPTKGFCIVFR